MNSLTALLQARRSETVRGIRWSATGEFEAYGALIERATRQAATLERLAQPGDTVLLVADNGPELLTALLACWWVGCIPSCWPPGHRLQHAGSYVQALQQAVDVAQVKLGFCTPRQLQQCAECSLPHGWRPLPLEEGDAPAVPGPVGPVAYLQFSSGTTMRPRPTALSHDNILSNLTAIASRLPGNPEENSAVSWLPLYHDMGLFGCFLSALHVRGNLTMMNPTQFALRPGRWLDEIHQHRATITAAPNFALEQVLARDSNQEPGARDLSCLRGLLLGAETVRPATLRSFYDRYRHQGLSWDSLIPVYGLAEATLAVTFSDGPLSKSWSIPGHIGGEVQPGKRELLSLGRPLPGVELQIVDAEGAALPERRLGLVVVGGPGVAINVPRPFNTGDVGFVDGGELYFVTRHKDVLIHHGRNHDPEAVESLIHPIEAAVVAAEDEAAVCLAERPRNQQHSDQQILEDLRARLGHAALPVRAVLVERGWLPRTSSGKISRQQARIKYSNLHHEP